MPDLDDATDDVWNWPRLWKPGAVVCCRIGIEAGVGAGWEGRNAVAGLGGWRIVTSTTGSGPR